MNLSLRFYSGFMRGIVNFLDCFPPKRVDAEEVSLRKGLCEVFEGEGDCCIWIHGASLGEIMTLRPLLRELSKLFGRERLLATATTMDGLKRIRSDAIVGRASLLPLEVPEFLDPFIDRMNPALVLISETEIWPLLLAKLSQRRIPYGIVNGRINPKTVKLIKVLGPLFKEAIDGLSFVFPQTSGYARRFENIGIPVEKIRILGGFKFEAQEEALDKAVFRKKCGIHDSCLIFCFGSTHPGEERIILEALEPLWKTMHATVILAPRHLSRLSEVESILDEFNLDFSRLSRQKASVGDVLLVDTLGDLKNLYSISSLAFVGGSLVPHGGHNLMEPAMYGVPIVSGPHTENFPMEISRLRANDAVFEVVDVLSLRKLLQDFLESQSAFEEAGKRSAQVLKSMSGAVPRTLGVLDEFELLPKFLNNSG